MRGQHLLVTTLSGLAFTLPDMAEPEISGTSDSEGREVVLLERIWHAKIVRNHPELRDLADQVLAVVNEPDHQEPDPRPGRQRFYRRGVGPSRWLMAVVSFDQEPARVVTALALRKDPKQWKP